MRSPIRLLLALVALIVSASVCLCVGVAAWVGATGATGLPGGLGTVMPVLLPTAGQSATPGVTGSGESPAAATAVAWALAQLGTPYRWGGEGDGGFDCSGLVQAAFAAAGVRLPRVAQDQYDAGPPVPSGLPLEPGDLVFFGSSSAEVEHVGIVVVSGQMVDAPHTGAEVRIEPIWSDGYVGATRPAP
ncbi:MAG TPA: C40 family peptidase [Acidimicrobiales bacterium]|nr:C40 family peptidase [Acidimicrobiales bacterium]